MAIQTGYLGNTRLKKIDTQFEFTQDQVLEYARCQDDIIYFIENYCKIITLDDGLQPFKMFEFQKKFIKTLEDNRFVMGMMPRQQSKTTCVAAYILHYVLFNEGVTVAILANKASAAREVMSRIQLMYEELPSWLQLGIGEWNKGSIELENKSVIFTAATSASSVRGKSCNLVYIDEAGILASTLWDEFYASTYPTISSGTKSKIIMTSTPMGYNHWWSMWTAAKKGKNGFVTFESKWQDHPKRDQAWADEQLSKLGPVKFAAEVCCSFVGSSFTLIDGEHIAKMSPREDKIFSKDGLDIYDDQEEKHTYVLVADTAKGVEGDYSAFTVIDITAMPYQIVAKYRNNVVSPLVYPDIIHKIATKYNNAFVLIETNSSEQVPYILYHELEYENLLMVSRSSSTTAITSQVVSGGFGSSSLKLGVTTDKKVKRIGCQNLKSLIETSKLIVEDIDIISELSTFVEKHGSYKADEGYHDDLVMTLVLFAWLTTNEHFKDLTSINLREMMYGRQIKAIEESLTPFGFRDNGIDEEEQLLNF